MSRADWHDRLATAAAGAYVALQAIQKQNEGRGAPDDDDMLRYIEEAHTIYDMVREAEERSDPVKK